MPAKWVASSIRLARSEVSANGLHIGVSLPFLPRALPPPAGHTFLGFDRRHRVRLPPLHGGMSVTMLRLLSRQPAMGLPVAAMTRPLPPFHRRF